MAFTSKISQVLKGRVNSGANSIKGFVDGAVGNINSQIDNFTSSFTGLQSVKHKQKRQVYLTHLF